MLKLMRKVGECPADQEEARIRWREGRLMGVFTSKEKLLTDGEAMLWKQ